MQLHSTKKSSSKTRKSLLNSWQNERSGRWNIYLIKKTDSFNFRMFGSKSYQLLPQSESSTLKTPGLFVSVDSFSQHGYHTKGLSFDYIPNVSENDFSDSSQGWLSLICNLIVIFLVHICTFITFPITGWFVLKTVPNYERIVVFRLGRVCPPKGPGIVLVLPLIDQWQRVDLRTRAFNIPPCQVNTRDGGLLSVGADIQFRIWNPVLSVVSVQDLNASTRMTAQNALTHSLAKKTIREIQTERMKLGEYLATDINEMTRPWGLEIDRVELTPGSLLKSPGDAPSGPLIVPPSVPGMEGLTGPLQQLAMHFISHSSQSQQDEKKASSVEELLHRVKLVLSEALVNQVGACFQFDISSDDGQHHSYYVDLSQGRGAAGEGSLCREPDVTLAMCKDDLLAMFSGTLLPLSAYSSGRLQIEGDMRTAMKLEELIKLLQK
ncbi:stomatin-like protein 1 isoform X2 [Dunckerocampus dactyliophorus]|uniref:stomatin-like protein 1 isoform X2 n=1 Tax=Dunckerocampus dactyliophorus TaxID=161453 RepID=UPI002406CED4|nr:stomatin-like protein 1 isoform X2 [Dunckerocampus dactyliophorus]